MPFDRLALSLLLLAVVVACQPPDGNAPTLTGPFSTEQLGNATYVGIADRPVTLSGGRWQGKPFVTGGASRPSVGLVPDFALRGDLDDNRGDETVVLLWSSSGGSGTRDYLAVMGTTPAGTPVNLATIELGDRVQLRSAAIVRRRLVVEIVQAGPGDPACCPGQKLRRTLALEGNTLRDVSREDLGRLSIADLAGVEWRLARFDADETLPDGLEITLVFEGYGISGRSACNRYNADAIAGVTPGALRIEGELTTTRMACPPPLDDIERRYLAAVQNISRYAFLAGQLALSWSIDDRSGTLVFARHARIAD